MRKTQKMTQSMCRHTWTVSLQLISQSHHYYEVVGGFKCMCATFSLMTLSLSISSNATLNHRGVNSGGHNY